MEIDIFRFKIDNYPKDNTPVIFKEIRKDINGLIKTNFSHEGETFRDDGLFSNDYISSNSKYYNNKYYNYYLTNQAKNNNVSEYTEEEKREFIFLMNQFFESEYYNKLLLDLSEGYNPDNLNLEEDEYSFIYKVVLEENKKVIVFGDHHGSFHTFYRNLIRLHLMNVIDLENYKINEDYFIIFLGDIVDRGFHSIEIISILLKFMINNKNILLNRGNHEDKNTNYRMGLMDEIKLKFKDDYGSIFTDLNQLLLFFPTAIILLQNSKIFWLSHGFLPRFNSETFFRFKNLTVIKQNILIINDKLSYEIKWNDPDYKSLELSDTLNPSRGMETLNIGLKSIIKWLSLFNFVIRGHNDNFANAWLLSKRKVNDNHILNLEHLIDRDYLERKEINFGKINGAIQTIKILPEYEDIYPVLTISTNTDMGRTLVGDSFILIRQNRERIITPNLMTNNIDFLNLKAKVQDLLGGKLIGKGSYGSVFGNPRLPCIDETHEEVKDVNEISKVFKNKSEEYQSKMILERNIRDVDINEYFVLPIKQCEINREEFNLHYNDEWKQGEFIDEFLNNEMIVYPKALNDLNNYNNIITWKDFKNHLKKLKNILDGIILLHNNNLVHLDIKPANILNIDDKYKIADISDIGSIDFNNPDHFNYQKLYTKPTNYVYYPIFIFWLLPIIFELYYNKQYLRNDTNINMLVINSKDLYQILNSKKDFNENNKTYIIQKERALKRFTHPKLKVLSSSIIDKLKLKIFDINDLSYLQFIINQVNTNYNFNDRTNLFYALSVILKNTDIYSFGYTLLEQITDLIDRELINKLNEHNLIILEKLLLIINISLDFYFINPSEKLRLLKVHYDELILFMNEDQDDLELF